MTYYEITNEEVVKYEVTLNRDELEKIRQEVTQTCTEVTHVVKNSAVDPEPIQGQTIQNLQKSFLFSLKLGSTIDRDVYKMCYDSYMEPRLIFLIDCLLEGNSSVIPEIKQFSQKSKKKEKKLSLYYHQVLESMKMTEVCRIPAQETNRLMEFFLNKIDSETSVSEKLGKDKNYQKQKRV